VCARTFPRCNNSTGTAVATQPCQSLCLAASTACTTYEKSVVLGNVNVNLPTECSSLPTTGCYDGVNSNFVQRTAYARCAPYTGSICRGVVDYQIYLPPHYTQDMFEAQLALSKPVLYVAPPKGCLPALLKYLCSRVWKSVLSVEIVGGILTCA
jgi:hypothetical protein